MAAELSELDRIVLICGRYEGVDERISEHLADREVSIGDYVLSGGELGAAVIHRYGTRLIPGAVGNQNRRGKNRLLDGRRNAESGRWAEFDVQFRRIAGLSALHAARGFSRYGGTGSFGERQPRPDSDLASQTALAKTLRNRPDLLERLALSEEDKKLLDQIKRAESIKD